MKKLILFLSSVVVILSLGNSLFGQGINSAQIDALVTRTLESTPSVGIAVAVVKDGELIHSKGYRIKSIESKKRVDASSLTRF